MFCREREGNQEEGGKKTGRGGETEGKTKRGGGERKSREGVTTTTGGNES